MVLLHTHSLGFRFASSVAGFNFLTDTLSVTGLFLSVSGGFGSCTLKVYIRLCINMFKYGQWKKAQEFMETHL